MDTASNKSFYSGTEAEITEQAATLIIAEAYHAISERGRFSLVLAGGNSPRSLYRQLARGVANNGKVTFIPWEKSWLFWGDERSVPANHPESNYQMARETLLSQAPIPENHIFRMPAEKEDGKEAAREYEETIRTFFQTASPHSFPDFPIFDLLILGLGDDGHTASLFPDNAEALQETKRWVIAVNEPHAKPPGKRLTLTFPVINHARNVLFFTTAREKAGLAKKIFSAEERGVPASRVKPLKGKTFWFTLQL
ncbi:MAG: 6-phosphogluconolactonase [Chlorobiaceae bacterium]|nr:6-phosphogluconolactonase [Chlorobiaceae bacterium]